MGTRACGMVVFRRFQGAIEFLLMQTSYQQHHWTPPKGHVDPGETDMQTALRETEEEAGLVANDLKIYEEVMQVLRYNVEGRPKIVIYWLAELLNHETPIRMSDEHQDFKWLPVEEACTLSKYSEMQESLRYFNEYIVKNLVQ